MISTQEEAAVGPEELPSKRQKLRNQIKLTELVSNGIGPALKILQLEGLHQYYSCTPWNHPPTDFQKMFQKKLSQANTLHDSIQQDVRSLSQLQQKWATSDAYGRLACGLTWLYDEEQQSQVSQIQGSIRQKAEQLRDFLMAWKNAYMNALILSMADN